jgi:hypothetical protein
LKCINQTITHVQDHPTDDSVSQVSTLLSYSIYNKSVETISNTYSTIYGSPESLSEFVPFLLESTNYLKNLITFGNQKQMEKSVFTAQKMPLHIQTLQQRYIESECMGLLTLLITCLLSEGGSYKSAVQTLVDSNWLTMIQNTFSILDTMCHFDLQSVQIWLKAPTELYHLILFSIYQYSVGSSTVPSKLIDDAISLIGYVIYN